MVTEVISEETTTVSESSPDVPYIPEVTVSDDTVIYDVSLYLPEYGEITGTISETRTAEVIKSLEEIKSYQQKQNDLLNIMTCIVCLMVGTVCGLLLTLHIKRR